MAKKKNPEQEQPATEEQEVETPAEEAEQPEQETPEQEAEEQGDAAEEADGDGPGEEDGEDPSQEQQQEEQPPSDADQEPASDENAALKEQLLQAQGKLAAHNAGVAKGMIDDAVTLAMAEAAKSGEITEASVIKAMEAVLKRHPEWKAEDEGKKKSGGFKLGADRDSGGTYKKPAGNTTTNVKRWNRFK